MRTLGLFTLLLIGFSIAARAQTPANAPLNPEWKTKQPFAAALKGDMKALAASGMKGLGEIIAATHAGMTPADFETIVRDWLASAKHPRFQRRYDELVYQPMLEVLAFFRANGFQTYIATGGGIEFVRVFSTGAYGIPPQQVVRNCCTTW